MDLFEYVTKGRGGKLFGKLMGVDQDEVEARRVERQTAFESGAPVEPPNAFLKWIADTSGLTADVMRARREGGLNPETGESLPAPRYAGYGPPTADGSIAGNAVNITGDTNVTITGYSAEDSQRMSADLEESLGRHRDSIAAHL